VHNHPSGVAEPSTADRQLTSQLKEALALINVRVLDHLVVTTGEVSSLAEKGLF
jgi:DNA repair protein RadC